MTRGVTVISGIITPTVVEWAERARPGALVAGWVMRPLTGGTVADLDQIEQALGRLRSLEDRDGSWRDRG
jgi:hypothetical protein